MAGGSAVGVFEGEGLCGEDSLGEAVHSLAMLQEVNWQI
jgi:hypothetical protein